LQGIGKKPSKLIRTKICTEKQPEKKLNRTRMSYFTKSKKSILYSSDIPAVRRKGSSKSWSRHIYKEEVERHVIE